MEIIDLEESKDKKDDIVGIGDRYHITNIMDNDFGSFKIIAFKMNRMKRALYIIFCIVTLGLLFLLCRWMLKWRIWMQMDKSNFKDCTHLYLIPEDKEDSVEKIVKIMKTGNNKVSMRYFNYRQLRYLWDGYVFAPSSFNINLPSDEIHTKYSKGHNHLTYQVFLEKFGNNLMNVPVKSYLYLTLNELSNPFYMFQLFSVVLWMYEKYYVYGCVIAIGALVGLFITVYQTKQNMISLSKLAKQFSQVNVVRDNQVSEISSEHLVPGDIIEIHSDLKIPCDVIVLSGKVVVDESMLTGESIPVIKNELSKQQEGEEKFDRNSNSNNVLFSGTNILQTISFGDTKVYGLVFGTGFMTAKGDLIRSILNPKPTKFKFYRDSMRFIGILAVIGILGFIYTVTQVVRFGDTIDKILVRALDMVTIVIPPALPVAFTMGTAFALTRLKKKSIYCIEPKRLNPSGRVDVMCFDKTGTLTEDSLDVLGLRCAMDGQFMEERTNTLESPFQQKKLLASCHSLVRLNGKFIGDPLDVKMFESTKWKYIGENESESCNTNIKNVDCGTNIEILKRFEFLSELQRMSVFVKVSKENENFLECYCKGSPEKIKELCIGDTIPKDFEEVLSQYTAQGYRVLGIAYKKINNVHEDEISNVVRKDVEKDLVFLGFFILENRLKPITSSILSRLSKAKIRNIMVTGDNVRTALSVARECKLVNPKNHAAICDHDLEENKLTVTLVPPFHQNNFNNQKSIFSNKSNLFKDEKGEKEDFEFKSGDSKFDFDNDDSFFKSKKNSFFNFILNENGNNNNDDDDDEEFRNNNNNIQKNESDSLRPLNNSEIPFSLNDALNNRFVDIAVTGPAFKFLKEHDISLFTKTVLKCNIFARMKPFQKASMIDSLKEKDFTVGMCGDGANDCGALKTADVGLSLADGEASVAAPFTSRIQNIGSVDILLREGRCALITSLYIFKYMALYSMIQFFTSLILISVGYRLGDWQFLWIDLFVVFPSQLAMARTEANEELSKEKPAETLLSSSVFSSLIGQLFLIITFQLSVWYLLIVQKWYVPIYPFGVKERITSSMGVSTLFLFANFQYILLIFSFSIGKPFRRAIYSNYALIICLIILIPANLILLFSPPSIASYVFELYIIPTSFKWLIVLMSVINSVLSYLFENFSIIKTLQRYDSF